MFTLDNERYGIWYIEGEVKTIGMVSNQREEEWLLQTNITTIFDHIYRYSDRNVV